MRIARVTVTMTAMAAMSLGLLGGCASYTKGMGTQEPVGATATAPLMTPDGTVIGRATAREVEGGLRVTIETSGLTPGLHGAHIHATGLCEAPGFTTAGGHWNPLGTQHGSMNPAGPHEGDLPNLIVGTDKRGTLAATIPGGTFAGLLDSDGAAMVIHAGPDDLKTDPSGNSGARLACGVFALS